MGIAYSLKAKKSASARQAVFAIDRRILAHAFDYDAGVLPCSPLLPHARDLDAKVLQVSAATFDEKPKNLTAACAKQIRLPVRYAGLQLESPSHIVPLARAARLVETGPALRAEIASWAPPAGLDAIDPKSFDGVDAIF